MPSFKISLFFAFRPYLLCCQTPNVSPSKHLSYYVPCLHRDSPYLLDDFDFLCWALSAKSNKQGNPLILLNQGKDNLFNYGKDSSLRPFQLTTSSLFCSTIVFTSRKAWLIVRPMTKEIDVKFYNGEKLESDALKKVSAFGKKYAHHIRLKSTEEVDAEVFRLLKIGHAYSLK